MSRLSFIVYSQDAEIQVRVSEALEATEHAEIWAVLATPADLEGALRTQRIDGVYLDVGHDPEAVLKIIENLPEPKPAILLGGSPDDPRILIRAMRLGAQEFFVDHKLDSQLTTLLAGIRAKAPLPPKTERPHLVFAVVGAKGGVGTTLVSCELAACLQRMGERTAVVDLNLQLGDVAMYFDLTPDYSIADIAKKGDALDAASLRTTMARHPSGVTVIAAPQQIDDVALVTPSHVERSLELMRTEFDRILLDVSRPWDQVSLRALGLADRILLVTTVDVPSLSHTKRHMELLERLGANREQLRLIVNRSTSSAHLGQREIEDFLGRVPDATIPNDYAVTARAVDEGKLIRDVARGAELDRAFVTLAELTYQWCDLEAPERDRGPGLAERIRGLLRR